MTKRNKSLLLFTGLLISCAGIPPYKDKGMVIDAEEMMLRKSKSSGEADLKIKEACKVDYDANGNKINRAKCWGYTASDRNEMRKHIERLEIRNQELERTCGK